MTSTVKWVFYIIGTVVAALLLYRLFFTADNNALNYVSSGVQKGTWLYYDTYCYSPSVNQYSETDAVFGVNGDSVDSNLVVYDTGWQ